MMLLAAGEVSKSTLQPVSLDLLLSGGALVDGDGIGGE
jgi:hypothetical protein